MEKMVEDAKKMAKMKTMKKKPCVTGGSDYKVTEKLNWENAKRSLVSKIETSARKEEDAGAYSEGFRATQFPAATAEIRGLRES